MYSVLFAIIVLSVLIYDCLGFYALSMKRRRELFRENAANKDFKYYQEHIANIVLMIFSGGMIMVGLFFLVYQHYVLMEKVDETTINFLAGMFGVFVIANIWYVRHIKKDEREKLNLKK